MYFTKINDESKSLPDRLHHNLIEVIIWLVVTLLLLLILCHEAHAYDELVVDIDGLIECIEI